MSKQTPVLVTVPAFNAPVKKVADAFAGLEKAGVKLGDVVISVAPSIPADKISVFCSMLQSKLNDNNPGKENSIKVQVSYIRKVITAIVVDGVEPEHGQTLRGLYDSLPKKATGGASHARKTNKPNDGEADEPETESKTVTLSKAEKRAMDINAAITTLFGTCNPDLVAAVEYAVSHSGVFMSWASASAKAAKLAELDSVLETAKPAPRKRATKTTKQAATA